MKKESFEFQFKWCSTLMKCPAEIRLEVFDAIMSYALNGTHNAITPMAQFVFSSIQEEIDKERKAYEAIVEKRRNAINLRWRREKAGSIDTNVYKCIQMNTNEYTCMNQEESNKENIPLDNPTNQQVSLLETAYSTDTNEYKCIHMNNTCIEEKENKQEKEKFPPNNPLIKEKEINKEKELSQEKNLKQVLSEKEKKSTVFKPPTLEQVKARIAEKGYTVNAEQFIAFYQSKGWMIGKNKMKDWKAALVTWQKRENDKRQTTHYGTSADIEYERRQAEFREYITQKLATPYVEPDISEFY